MLAGTVDAIYRELEGNIEIEIDFGEETTVRQMVLDAMVEIGYWQQVNSSLGPGEEPVLPLVPDSTDTEERAEDPKPERLAEIRRGLRALLW